jgi:hypothetical protein
MASQVDEIIDAAVRGDLEGVTGLLRGDSTLASAASMFGSIPWDAPLPLRTFPTRARTRPKSWNS